MRASIPMSRQPVAASLHLHFALTGGSDLPRVLRCRRVNGTTLNLGQGKIMNISRHVRIANCFVESVDGGDIDRIVVSNIVMAAVRAPIFVRLGKRGRAQKTPAPGQLQNVSFAESSKPGPAGAPSRRFGFEFAA